MTDQPRKERATLRARALFPIEPDASEYQKALQSILREGYMKRAFEGEPWIRVEDERPPELETVWGINRERGIAMLCCVIYHDEGWCWARSNGSTYIAEGMIVSECEEDDLDITEWQPLPFIAPLPSTT